MSLSTYKKRGGVSDRGKDYEWLLCALYSFTFSTSHLVTDFELFTNNEFFGDFDDVTLRVKFSNGQVKIFLLQLKHSEKTKTLALNSLASSSGDFALLKYIKSYENLISLGNFHFILYVNKTANFKDKTKLTLESKEIYIRQHFCVGENLLNTSKSKNCSVFKLEAGEENVFANFFLYVNQQNDVHLKQSIADLLKTSLHCDIYTTFIEFIRTWWAGNFKLTKYDVVSKLAELVLSPMIRTLSSEESNERTKIIEEIILKFDLTLLDGRYGKNFAKIWSKANQIYDIKRVSLTSLKFGLTTKGIGRMEELSIEQRAKVLWFMDEVPLLVEVDHSKKEQIDAIILLLEQCKPKKKIILVGYPTERDFTKWKIFKDLSDISDDLRKTITQTLTCSLQGKKPITLEKLGAYDSKITSTFRVDQLLKIATHDNFIVGESLETLPTIYIPRSFYKILFNYKVIDSLEECKIFLSYNGKKNIAQTKFNKRSVDISDSDTEKFPKYKVFVCDSEFAKEKLAKEFASECDSHHFRVVNGQNLQWLDSSGNIEKLENHKKFNPAQIFDEGEIETHFQKKIRILTSHTGTGKTTFLNRVKNVSLPNYFVIKMDLKDHFGYFRRDEEAWDYIVNFTRRSRNYDDFEVELLRNFDKERIIILWDSLDELPSEFVYRFVETVRDLHSSGVTQWIAAQNSFRTFLEHTFEVFVVTMLPFSQEEQIFYIKNQCGDCDDQIIRNFMENMKIIDSHEYLGVPLQLYVLSETFSNYELLHKIYTLTDMLTAFIDGKYNHYLERNGDLTNFRGFRNIIEDAKTHRLDQYKIAAMKTYLPEFYQKLNLQNTAKFFNEMKEGDFLGLIRKVDQENNFVFEHQILGEFLSALYLANHLPIGLEKIIFKEEFRTIRFMFDLLLAENKPAFVAILYKKYDQVGNDRVKDRCGRNPLHLICSYGAKHPLLKEKHSDDRSRYLLELNSGSIQEDSEDLKLTVKSLCKMYNCQEKDTLFSWTSFDYADHSCSLGLLECLEEVKEVVPKLQSYSLGTLLYYSIRFNYSKIFASLKQLPFVQTTNKDNLIHLATEFNRDNHLTRLLSQKVYKTSINKLNKDKWSPLHVATFNGNLPLIKFLLNKGATFMLQQPSVMSLAVAKGRKDIVEFFLQCGCSPNEFYHTNHFTTSIFQAINLKHDTIVELLLRNGARLYCVNRATSDDAKPNPFGMNLFHMLLENEQFEEAEMVLKKGIHIDSVDNEGRTAFHHAAVNNQERVVRYLLAKGGNHRILDRNRRSPLHCAAGAGSVEVSKILIEAGVDLNLQDDDGLTPLHTAVVAGNTNFVMFLAKERVNPNIANKYGRTPMHMAAIYDLSECMEFLYLHGGDLEARDGLYGRTPLHLAAWHDNDECVQFLLDKGIPVDCSCNFGFTPLHLAVEKVGMKSCELLLKAGASVSVVNKNGKTPLDMIKNGYLLISRLFMVHDPVPLHSAVARGDIRFLNELLTLDFDVNGIDGDGNTPLHIAVRCRDASALVETLLEAGGDVKKQNPHGFTPLHCALQSDFVCAKVIKMLLEIDDRNCTVNSATMKKVTPLHIATQNTFTQKTVVELLLEKGAQTDAQDDLGFTPLHYASSNGNLKMVTLLVNADSNVNRTSKSGRTPLHLASTRRHLTIVNFLLVHGALIKEDCSGDTPLHDALKAEDSQIFKILYNQKADFDVCTRYLGRTILHVAAKNGSLELVKFFIDKGVPVGDVDFDGSIVLEEALYNRHYDLFDFLLDKSEFQVNKFNKRYAKYPLHVVTSTGIKKLVKFFLSRGAKVGAVDDDGNTPLHIAVDCGQTEIFLLLLNHDCSAIDSRNKKGETILHKAMQWEKTELVTVLVNKGANVDVTDKKGWTPFDFWFHEAKLCPEVLFKMKIFDVNKHSDTHQLTLLHLAVHYESLETINWLKQQNASINCEDINGDTPLHFAARLNSKMFPVLLEKWKDSIDLEKPNYEGETVLHLAAETFPQIVKQLLQLGASPHTTTKYGATPLFYALKNPQCFKILWERTPEVQIFNVAGHMTRTVLHKAAASGDLDCVKFFLQVGLKINEADNTGNTPVSDATLGKHYEVLKVLLEKDTNHHVVNTCKKEGISLLHSAAHAGDFDLVKLLVKFKARSGLCDSNGRTAADVALERGVSKIHEFLKKHEDVGNKDYF